MSISEPEPLEKSEADAIDDAVIEVAELLKDGKSLDMIEQHIYRMRRKKDMVETRLKEAVEAQLRGVRTGLFNLQKVMREANDICTSMKTVNSLYGDLSNQLGDNAKEIRDTRIVHREHALLNSYLQNIYNFKDDVKKAHDYLSNDDLLQAHEILMKLEDCRDGIYKEVMDENIDDEKRLVVEEFFSGLVDLNNEFLKKIKFFLNKALNSVRSGQTCKLVSMLRIIEREEKKDLVLSREMEANSSLTYPGRPKKWRVKGEEALAKSVADTFEGLWELNQEDDSWVLTFSHKVKRITENDLKTVDQYLRHCFPPHWNIVEYFCSLYQSNIRLRFEEIINQIRSSLGQASSYIIVFNWANVLSNIIKPYRVKEKHTPILTPDHIHTLVQCYTDRLEFELTRQTDKILKQERDGRYELNKFPDRNQDRANYHTITPVIFYEMINQNLEFAFKLESKMELIPILRQLDSRIKFFIERYVEDLREFTVKYFETPEDDREEMKYVEWLIAASNNAIKCAALNDDLVLSLTKQSDKDIMGGDILEKEKLIVNKGELFRAYMLRSTCLLFSDLVFSDLKPIIAKLFTSEWTNKCLMTMLVTIDDYNDSYFNLIDDIGNKTVLKDLSERMLLEYLIALFNTKSLSHTTAEFKELLLADHEKICSFFDKTLAGDIFPRGEYNCLQTIAELVSESDELIEMVMAEFVNSYPDVQFDQCVALLALRANMNNSEIKDLVSGNNVSETPPLEQPANPTIFWRVHQATGPLSSRFFQTVVAPRAAGFRAPAVNLNTSVNSTTSNFSKIGSNISTAISNSPVYHAINQAWNEKDQLQSKAVRALDFSTVDIAERTNPFSDDPRDGKGPAPRPPPKKKGPAPAPPTKSAANPFDDDE